MRSGRMRLVRMAAAGMLAVGLWAQGAGAAEVRNVTAEYAWPWGVEIRYEVVGTLSPYEPLVVWAKDRTENVTYFAEASALSGDTGQETGTHHLHWDLDKQGVKLQSTNVEFTVAYEWPLYCVVDLSAGPNATSYPVTELYFPPNGGFNTDIYKTTKLVLRRIDPGTFKMCGSYQTTLTKPYYISIFEVTQKQYWLVSGNLPAITSVGDKLPVENVPYKKIRGSWYTEPSSSAVSASSFMGRLRARTGLDFDLPTEAQWEYACRARTTTSYSYGDSANGNYMWYAANSSSEPHEVGTKQPNAWGLYDMHGNVWEWCRDWFGDLTNGVSDPVGPSSGGRRVKRGGMWRTDASYCTSFYRAASSNYDSSSERDGFRLVRIRAE